MSKKSITKKSKKIDKLEEELKKIQESISKSNIIIPSGIFDYSYPPAASFQYEYQSRIEVEYSKFSSDIKNIITDIENVENTYFITGNEDRIKIANILKKHMEIIKFNIKLDKIINE